MKLEGINWFYLGLSCAESMAVPVCLDRCCYLATQSNDFYTGVLMLIQGGKLPQNHKQVFFFTRVGWLSSRACISQSRGQKRLQWWQKVSVYLSCGGNRASVVGVKMQGKSSCADREDFRAL